MSQSVEDNANVTTINLQSTIGPASLAVPRPSRTLGRTQSAGEAPPSLISGSAAAAEKSPDPDGGRRSATPTKRSRFLLKRQDCLEKGNETELDLSIAIRSSPNSPLMLASPYASLGSPPPAPDNPPVTSGSQEGVTATLLKQRSSADLSLDCPSDQFYNEQCPPPAMPPVAHKLPSVRVIPDACMDDPLSLDMASSLDQGHLPSNNNLNYGLLHPNFRLRPSLDQFRPMASHSDFMYHAGPPPPPSHYMQAPPPPISVTSTPTEQFGHCPKERDGPALGCNYCWNTTDVNGRILRRKTKYHCPDCQANLCIVPCFQAYHEALDKEKAEAK